MVFVVLDGSGKSTQALMLCRYMKTQKKTFINRSHPSYDNFFGRMGRGYLLLEGTKTKIAASFFYLLDVLRSVVLYRWRNVDHVIFIRYLMDTAYLPKPLFKLGYHFFKRIIPESRYMFLIDISSNEAYKRIKSNRDQKEMFESLEKFIEMRG